MSESLPEPRNDQPKAVVAVPPASAPVKPAPAGAKPAASTAPKPAAPPPPPSPPPPVSAGLAGLHLPLLGVDYASRGCHAEATVAPEEVVKAAQEMDRAGFAIDTITGLDWIAQGQMEVVYDYFHPTEPWRVAIRTRISRENPELPTICSVFAGANWHERETHDFFGIRFLGHPDLSPFLLPEDATYHPLKKDFKL